MDQEKQVFEKLDILIEDIAYMPIGTAKEEAIKTIVTLTCAILNDDGSQKLHELLTSNFSEYFN